MPMDFEKRGTPFTNPFTRRDCEGSVLNALRPDASLDIIRGAGHWVQFEAAASFDAACLRWLAALADAGGPR